MGFFHDAAHDISLHKLLFTAIRDPEGHIHINKRGIAPDDPRAEAVDRRDPCAVDKRQLPPQVVVSRPGLQFFQNSLADPLFHLSGSRPRKRDDQKFIDVSRVFRVRQPADKARDKHSGLAGAGSRAHEEIFPPRRYDIGLILRPVDAHDPITAFILRIASSLSMVLITRSVQPSSRRSNPQTPRYGHQRHALSPDPTRLGDAAAFPLKISSPSWAALRAANRPITSKVSRSPAAEPLYGSPDFVTRREMTSEFPLRASSRSKCR